MVFKKGQIPWNKGRKCLEISEGERGVPRLSLRGKKYSEEHKKHIREAKMGSKNPNFGKHLSEETKKKLSKSLKGHPVPIGFGIGRKHSENTIKKMSEKRKEYYKKHPNFNKGVNNWRYENHTPTGIKHTEEYKKKMSERMMGNQICKGELSPMWKGGISFEPYGQGFSKELRHKIRVRDGFQCQICLKNGFCVHHIDFNKRNNIEGNLITLCRSCHGRVGHREEYYIWQLKVFAILFITNKLNVKNPNFILK